MKAKRIIIGLVAILLLISLASCEFSCYFAIGLVRITRDDYCETNFLKLDGRLVFSPRYTKNSEAQIHYVASLEEGEVNVYYELSGGGHELLFNIKAGETLDSRGGYIEKGKQTIIIETVSPAKGKITIEFE
jgi:hypothetical protein